jgi:hypothetical protein
VICFSPISPSLILLMAAPRHSHFIINDKVAVRTPSKSAMTDNWSHEETDDTGYADRRNFSRDATRDVLLT